MLTVPPVPAVLGVGVVAVVAPLPDAAADPAADGDNDEVDGIADADIADDELVAAADPVA